MLYGELDSCLADAFLFLEEGEGSVWGGGSVVGLDEASAASLAEERVTLEDMRDCFG